ncbi:MAG: hypothetical protein RTU92_00345 [Candidatus Thorarchaeota archaeon]
MELQFQCPDCKGKAIVQMTDDEANKIQQRILNEGRSPTLIIKCENSHELLVTLYNLRSGDGLGVRDVVVAVRADTEKPESDVDWLTKAFGGGS